MNRFGNKNLFCTFYKKISQHSLSITSNQQYFSLLYKHAKQFAFKDALVIKFCFLTWNLLSGDFSCWSTGSRHKKVNKDKQD